MKKIFLVAFLIPVLSFTCLKKTPNCHTSITFKNNSDFTVFRAFVTKDDNNNCRYSLDEFKAGASYTVNGYKCYEKNENFSIDMYIISPEKVAQRFLNRSFSCDSIATANKILKHYEINLQYLQEHKWEVSYPE